MTRRTDYRTPLNVPAKTIGEYAIEHDVRPAGAVIKTGDMRTAMFGQGAPKELSWPTETRWHRLIGPTGTWMTDLPIEQYQHDRSLKGMKGRILIGGLGLGYAAAVLAKQASVKEVVVVEIPQEVIDLTAKHIPDPKSKTHVINMDLFTYLDHYAGEPFDYAFFDIWQSDGEGTFFEVVCPLRKASQGKVRRSPVCWNEDVMRGQLYCSMWSRMLIHKNPSFGGNLRLRNPTEEDGTDEPWHNWMCPFFRWVERTKPDDNETESVMRLYASTYGLSSFKEFLTLLGEKPK